MSAKAKSKEEIEETKVYEHGTIEWLQSLSDDEGQLPSPINISITGSTKLNFPVLKWYNFEVYPHKIKVTNTGFTVLLGAKWKTERPYLEGGCLLEKHVISQMHFHWGSNMMEGSDHAVDQRKHPGELQVYKHYICISYLPNPTDTACANVVFFKSEYMTQQEALYHNDGHSVKGDERLQRVIEALPRIQEAKANTRIGPHPMKDLIPMFCEDYFLYWGKMSAVSGEEYIVRWLVPRTSLFATDEQMKEFRKLLNPWDDPNLANFRPLRERGERHLFLINGRWNLYNSLLPVPRITPEPSISELSPAYRAYPWMIPAQNADFLPPDELNEDHKSKTQTVVEIDR